MAKSSNRSAMEQLEREKQQKKEELQRVRGPLRKSQSSSSP